MSTRTVPFEEVQSPSADLFKFTPMGKRLPEVQTAWDKTMHMMENMRVTGLTPDAVAQTRGSEGFWDSTSDEFLAQCEVSEETVDGTAYGSEKKVMKVLIFVPKGIKDKNRRAVIWFHGGGFIAGSPDTFKKLCARMAVSTSTVVFSPEIGVAPETKAPHWFRNGYACLKWVHTEATRFGLDQNRVALAGQSAGAYTGLGVCMELASKGEEDLAKVFVSDIGAFNNDFLDCKPEDEAEEMHRACSLLHMQSMALLVTDDAIGFDWANHKDDPAIFPAQMDEALLPKLPPIVLMTSEFDHVGRRGSERFAARLKPHGKLLGLYIQAGVGHSMGTPETQAQRLKDEVEVFTRFL